MGKYWNRHTHNRPFEWSSHLSSNDAFILHRISIDYSVYLIYCGLFDRATLAACAFQGKHSHTTYGCHCALRKAVLNGEGNHHHLAFDEKRSFASFDSTVRCLLRINNGSGHTEPVVIRKQLQLKDREFARRVQSALILFWLIVGEWDSRFAKKGRVRSSHLLQLCSFACKCHKWDFNFLWKSAFWNIRRGPRLVCTLAREVYLIWFGISTVSLQCERDYSPNRSRITERMQGIQCKRTKW